MQYTVLTIWFHITGYMFFEDHFELVIADVVPIALTSILCSGNESSLSECTFTEYVDDHSCTHQNDIIIECAGKCDVGINFIE